MRSFYCVFPLLFSCVTLALGQTLINHKLINHKVLSGNGGDQPAVIATDSQGFV